MKLIYVASPMRGDVEGNIKRAAKYCEHVMNCGHIPIAPHLAWRDFLDDETAGHRENALKMALSLIERVDEVWVFGDVISDGMRREIEVSEKLGKTILFKQDFKKEVMS